MRMIKSALLAASLLTLSWSASADETACRKVRFSDPGWTDITSTTALASAVLEGLGYEPSSDTLSVAVTLQALRNGDIDVFLGNWMPAQTEMVKPYLESGVEVVVTNLEGAKVTLAVNRSAWEAGVKSFADLHKFGDRFGKTIYSIEPGSSASEKLHAIIDSNDFELGDWKLSESSEQAMLSQVDRASRRNEWVVFLGWEPHPMNLKYEIAYLDGGDKYFGPNYGGATVRTLAHTAYLDQCPNLRKFFSQLVFDVKAENEMMHAILDKGMDPADAAEEWLKANPQVLERWLDGVTTIDGESGLPAVTARLGG